MTKFKSGTAGVLVMALAVAGAAFAQDAATKSAQSTQATEPKAATTQAAPAPAAEAKPAPAKTTAKAPSKSSTPKSIVGEVVDPACWIVNGSKGAAHTECALACAKAGQVLAILERKTNKLFLIATERPGEDPNKGLIDYCGQTVLAKGKFFTRGGVTAIQLSSVEPASAKSAP